MTQYHAVRSLTIRSLEGMPFVGLLQHLSPRSTAPFTSTSRD